MVDDYEYHSEYEEDYDIEKRKRRNTILCFFAALVVFGIWGYFIYIAVDEKVDASDDSSSNVTAGISLNINLQLDQATQNVAIESSATISQSCPGNQIIFSGPETNAIPHITLYMTEFLEDAVDSGLLQSRIAAVVSGTPVCPGVTLQGTTASGSYGMWEIPTIASCLQALSDKIVNATYDLIVPDQPVPSWVYSLPNQTEQAEKEQMVALYGSPNVFSQFDPHVTLAYDDSPSDSLPLCLGELNLQSEWIFEGQVVAVGYEGPYGTLTDITDSWTLFGT